MLCVIIGHDNDVLDSTVSSGKTHYDALVNSIGEWPKREGCFDFNETVKEWVEDGYTAEDCVKHDEDLYTFGEKDIYFHVRWI